jgi:hypothetical protein
LPATCIDATHTLNQCTGAVTSCAAYGLGWSCVNGSCKAPPPPIANISAVPRLVSPLGTANIGWTSTNAASCTVTGNNGDGPWSATAGSHVTSPIASQTTFTLACLGLDGSTIARTAMIDVIPNWKEN